MYYIINGSIRYQTENKTVAAQAGDAVLIRKDSNYTAFFEMPETVDYLINFDSDGEVFLKEDGNFVLFHQKNPAAFLSDITHLVECVNRYGKGNQCLLSAYFFLLLADLFTPPAANKTTSETVRIVEEDTAFALGEKELARKSGMSLSTFRRNFFSVTGMNPSEYRNALKISRAKTLLSEGNENVEQIAEQLGFCDGVYFSRFFKKRTGFSPSAYRKHSRSL